MQCHVMSCNVMYVCICIYIYICLQENCKSGGHHCHLVGQLFWSSIIYHWLPCYHQTNKLRWWTCFICFVRWRAVVAKMMLFLTATGKEAVRWGPCLCCCTSRPNGEWRPVGAASSQPHDGIWCGYSVRKSGGAFPKTRRDMNTNVSKAMS